MTRREELALEVLLQPGSPADPAANDLCDLREYMARSAASFAYAAPISGRAPLRAGGSLGGCKDAKANRGRGFVRTTIRVGKLLTMDFLINQVWSATTSATRGAWTFTLKD